MNVSIVFTYLIPIATLIIAGISLGISLKVYYRDTPKIRIEIEDPKYDCYFGQVQACGEGKKPIKARIAGINGTLRNHSSANIQIIDAKLKINGEFYKLIPTSIDCWKSVDFLSLNEETGNLEPDFIYDGLNYAEVGFSLPIVIEGYSFAKGTMLFYHFPAHIKEETKATLYIKTAVGTTKKRVRMLEYHENNLRADWDDYQQYKNSCE